MSIPLPVVEPVSSATPAGVPAEKIVEKPHLTLVTPPAPAPKAVLAADVDPTKDIASVLGIYKTQNRECWLCSKIASTIEAGKDASDDDKWHFATCVLSWANLQTP